MKKIIIVIIILLSLTGCTNLKTSGLSEIVSNILKDDFELTNKYRTGFRYYLPTNLNSISSSRLNEVLANDDEHYYLYVDLVSYFNKVNFSYEENDTSYFSQSIINGAESGYLEINQKNDKYLIEIMYNYAKIEVIVDKERISEAVANSLIVLSSIEFNDEIIKNMMGEDILNFSEEEFNIFETEASDSNFLEYVQEYDNYEADTEDIPDYDLIN